MLKNENKHLKKIAERGLRDSEIAKRFSDRMNHTKLEKWIEEPMRKVQIRTSELEKNPLLVRLPAKISRQLCNILHAAFERLKSKGAADYTITGTATILLPPIN